MSKKKEELEEKYVKLLGECFTGDTEDDHAKADGFLCELLEELGFHKVVEKFESIEKWYA